METNPGGMLDELGLTCEELYQRFVRTGNHVAQQAMWDALQEFSTRKEIIEAQYPDRFGEEV